MSLSDGSAILQQLCADYPSYSPGGTTVQRHVTYVFFWISLTLLINIYMTVHSGATW